jgi:hypothetical protein
MNCSGVPRSQSAVACIESRRHTSAQQRDADHEHGPSRVGAQPVSCASALINNTLDRAGQSTIRAGRRRHAQRDCLGPYRNMHSLPYCKW